MNDQAQRLRELARKREGSQTGIVKTSSGSFLAQNRCKSIAVTSGKGGVGKTNISLFLATTLAGYRKKVLLLDADLGLANVHILMGISPKQNISHFIEGQCDLKQVICKAPGGIDIIPGASGLEKLANIDRGRLEYLQREFSKLEQLYDFLIIDTGAGIGSIVTQFASKADIAVLVLTPEPTSLADAYATVKVLYEKGCQKISAVVNMAVSDKEGAETFDRLNTLVIKFLKRPLVMLGTLPYERELPKSVRQQRVFVTEKINSQFNARVQVVARKLSGMIQLKKSGFFARFWKGCLSG